MNEIKQVVNQNYDECKNKNGFILWENRGSPTSFNGQKVTFNTDDYDYFDVICYPYYDVKKIQVARCYKGYSTTINSIFEYNSKLYWGVRNIDRVSDTEYFISNAGTFGSNDPLVFDINDWYIPLKIIGYRW